MRAPSSDLYAPCASARCVKKFIMEFAGLVIGRRPPARPVRQELIDRVNGFSTDETEFIVVTSHEQ